jgi:xylulose-5-phosphate/fructose-6-phosphate phosphoketolase
MAVLNHMDRFQLALDVIRRMPGLKGVSDEASQQFSEAIQRHRLYVAEQGEDLPEVRDWRWTLS